MQYLEKDMSWNEPSEVPRNQLIFWHVEVFIVLRLEKIGWLNSVPIDPRVRDVSMCVGGQLFVYL